MSFIYSQKLTNTNIGSSKILNFFEVLERIMNKKYFSIFFILSISQIVQLTSLQVETLNWDINTFIVTSQDISRGNLPLTEQWENKGPLLFILYFIPQLAFENSFLAIKLFNDLIFSILSLSIFFISKKVSNNNLSSLSSVLFFVLITGIEFEGHAGYSEYYALLFIGLSIYVLQNKTSVI